MKRKYAAALSVAALPFIASNAQAIDYIAAASISYTPPRPTTPEPEAKPTPESAAPVDSDSNLTPVPPDNLRVGLYGGTTNQVFNQRLQLDMLEGKTLPVEHMTAPHQAGSTGNPKAEQSTPEVVDVNSARIDYVQKASFSYVLSRSGLSAADLVQNKVAAEQTVTTIQQTSVSNDPWSFENYAWMFEGGSEAYATIVIGNAEGTRGPNGEKWQAYHGHTDPGNGVWNLGSFSYQHGASSPEEADQKQLVRLQNQAKKILEQARATGVILDDWALINALDLANQSPTSGLGADGKFASEGFVAILTHQVVGGRAENGKYTKDQIIDVRTATYIHPDKNSWTSTGLRRLANQLGTDLGTATRHDQARRVNAMWKAHQALEAKGKTFTTQATNNSEDNENIKALFSINLWGSNFS